MIGDILQPSHLLFILVVALLVLGPKRLPEVGRALGRGLRDFRQALNTDEIRDHVTSTRDVLNTDELRDQIIAPTDTSSAPPVHQTPPEIATTPVEQPPAEAVAAPVEPPTHQPATTPEPGAPATTPEAGSSASAIGDAASSQQEAIRSPEPTATAPTPERVP